MRRRTGPTPRAGYTLVELLIVIAIIAILAALLTSALSKVRQSVKKTTTTSEINQLDMALTSFERKHAFYPPSHVGYLDNTSAQQIGLFRIPEMVHDQSTAVTDVQKRELASLIILRRMFPRWNPNPSNLPLPATITPALAVPAGGRDLDPNQAMVYFLGGPGTLVDPATPGRPNLGWDTAGPYSPTGNTRIDPYYSEFIDARLRDEAGAFGTAGTFDGRYRDPWGTPYAYFASNAGSDQYDPRVQFPWTTNVDKAPPSFDPSADPHNGDTTSGALAGAKINTVHPIATDVSTNTTTNVTTIRWVNPKKVQIISAGPDKVFGRGSHLPTSGQRSGILKWNPGVGNGYSEGEKGEDDIANFNNGTALGAQGTGN